MIDMREYTKEQMKHIGKWIENTNVCLGEIDKQIDCVHDFKLCYFPQHTEPILIGEDMTPELTDIKSIQQVVCFRCGILEEDYNKYVKGKL